VLKVFIHAEPVEPRRTQHGLFAPASPEAENLAVEYPYRFGVVASYRPHRE
jgi:hypothetical protein